MKWYLKFFIQKALSNIPEGEKIYRNYQIRFGGLKKIDTSGKVFQALSMINALEKVGFSLEGKTCFEIGTGWIPIIPIIFFIFGQKSCTTVDIEPLLNPDLTKAVISDLLQKVSCEINYRKILSSLQENRIKLVQDAIRKNDKIFLKIGLTALIIKDNLFPNIQDKSLDLIFSNETLEHLSVEAIENYLRQGKTKLRENGLLIHNIDCGDHYSYSDNNISRINFLRYSERDWKKFNTRFLFQNRLRVSDYKRIIEQNGYKVIYYEPKINKQLLINKDIQKIISQDFNNYSNHDLISTSVLIIASK